LFRRGLRLRQVHLVLQLVHPRLMTYLLWMQVLAVGTKFEQLCTGKTYRHRMDSLSARWQRSIGMNRDARASTRTEERVKPLCKCEMDALFLPTCLMGRVPSQRFGITSSAAEGASLPTEKRFGLGRYPFRVRMWYFFKRSPANCTLIVRHPRLGFGFG
jgi:hypothetical protein